MLDRKNIAYRKVLEHRRKCSLWGKGFCLDCFGGGLSKFAEEYGDEQMKVLGLPSTQKAVEATIEHLFKMWELKKLKEQGK